MLPKTHFVEINRSEKLQDYIPPNDHQPITALDLGRSLGQNTINANSLTTWTLPGRIHEIVKSAVTLSTTASAISPMPRDDLKDALGNQNWHRKDRLLSKYYCFGDLSGDQTAKLRKFCQHLRMIWHLQNLTAVTISTPLRPRPRQLFAFVELHTRGNLIVVSGTDVVLPLADALLYEDRQPSEISRSDVSRKPRIFRHEDLEASDSTLFGSDDDLIGRADGAAQDPPRPRRDWRPTTLASISVL